MHAHNADSHENHHGMMIADFKKRFWIALIITIPILLLSPMIQMFFNYTWVLPHNDVIIFVLSSIIYVYGGKPFLVGMITELKHKQPGMMLLIGMAISVAYFYSVATTFGFPGEPFYWELAALIVIMLLGHWLEMKSTLAASRSLELLVKLLPAQAHLIINQTTEDIPLAKLKVGDRVLVKPGEQVPADGVVVEGSSYLNESMLTGESKPVLKQVNDKVIAGSINAAGYLKIRVAHAGKDSYLSKVIHLVQEAQQTKSKTQRLADKAARWLTIIAIVVGCITLISWLLAGFSTFFAIERMVTVMIISCPHALGLAIPLVVTISTTLAAHNGLLIRNRSAFENARNINVLIFDKTGTLTLGKFAVVNYKSLDSNYDPEKILALAAALEQYSEHPIALAILAKAQELKLQLPRIENFLAKTGEGVQGDFSGQLLQVVSPNYLSEHNIDETINVNSAETTVYLLLDKQLIGVLMLADEIRPESYAAVQELKKEKIRVMMVTGDNAIVAKAVSDTLQLDGFYANILPHQKLAIIKKLQDQGEIVAMTGDDVNDAPALAQADIGIAIGSGTDIAAETADIILVKSDPNDIVYLIKFGRATYQKMRENLLWATGYNVIAIPLAAGALYFPYKLLLGPALGAVLMSLSTVIVAINAQLLRRYQVINKS